MIIEDKVYSTYKINDPLAIDLINTKLFQRLKHINQFGLPDEYFYKNGFSRYEHSIGVYILLDKLGADEEEKIAGLLHDISHTAFSHLVDWAIGDRTEENYQDNMLLTVLGDEEISKILMKGGYDFVRIANESNFSLLEREVPDLCADRIDYVLREGGLDRIEEIVANLRVINNTIVFSGMKEALLFGRHFLFLQTNCWGGYEGVTRYNIFSKLLKNALESGDISIEDFWKTDDEIIAKLKNKNNKKYNKIFSILSKKDLSSLNCSSEKVCKKFRYVDPEIIINSKITKLSDINEDFAQDLIKAKEKNKEGIYPGTL